MPKETSSWGFVSRPPTNKFQDNFSIHLHLKGPIVTHPLCGFLVLILAWENYHAHIQSGLNLLLALIFSMNRLPNQLLGLGCNVCGF